jgi:hypothetical protein
MHEAISRCIPVPKKKEEEVDEVALELEVRSDVQRCVTDFDVEPSKIKEDSG